MVMDAVQTQPSTAGTPDAAAVILVVDDNEANRDALSRRLQRKGYTTLMAEDGPKSLAILKSQPVDLVLLDVMMPGMNGLEVLEEIRRTRAATDLPVVMATARDESQDIVKALSLGANDYVTKPLDFAVVLARVNTQLSAKSYVRKIVELEQRLSERNAELESANAKLQQNADRLREELDAAARIQQAFLPRTLPGVAGARFSWAFEPCQELAGDALNILRLDADHVAAYVLDVSGHGVAASLLAVAAARVLSAGSDSSSILVDKTDQVAARPAEVARQLNEKFAWDAETGQFLTLFYAVLNARTREFSYISCGHPGAIRISGQSKITTLEGSGLPIGLGENFEQQTVQLDRGDRVILYSDGVTEAMNPNRQLFGKSRLTQFLVETAGIGIEESASRLLAELKKWQGGLPSHDDISILAIECT
jgi:sigma-B regulation protein RsbU (phosphoserine phosphatase)